MSRKVTMSRKPPRSNGAHRGATRVLDILEFLPGHSEGFTLAEISRALAVPKSSVLALLRTLVERGYLVLESGLYRAGARAHGLGARSGFQRELPAAARPALLELAQRTGESVYLAVLTSQPPEVVYVDKVESRQSIRYSADLGERRPLYCTAPGLAAFAFMPAADRTRVLASLKLVAFTEATVTSRDAIRLRLDEIRQAGIVVNVDEFMAGASGIAAPILDAQGVAVGACTVIGPTPRLLAQEKDLVRRVRAAGEAISHALGAR
jgi:IclR family acetate operon transcriptional repressor